MANNIGTKLYTDITFNALVEQKGTTYVSTTYKAETLKSPSGATQNVMIGQASTKNTTTTYSTLSGKTYNYKKLTSDMAQAVLNTFMRLTTGDKSTVATARDFNSLNAFIKGALSLVSQQRSDLGAIQNRLDHTIANLNNIVENTQSAEAAIRDTDIATEMVQYSNNNILQQAGTSMLSQANQSNQLALSLLG